MHVEGYIEDVAAIFNTHPVSLILWLTSADDSEELLYETHNRLLEGTGILYSCKHVSSSFMTFSDTSTPVFVASLS